MVNCYLFLFILYMCSAKAFHLSRCQARMIFLVLFSPKTPFHALKKLSESSDMNQFGKILPHLALIAVKKGMIAIASSLFDSIQPTGIPSSITTIGIQD